MKTIEIGIVEMYVNGVLHTLDLTGHHLEKNNQHSTQIEIENAKVELRALSQDLKSRRENQTQEVDMPKWEYMVIHTSYGTLVDRVNGEEIIENDGHGMSCTRFWQE